MEKQTIIKGAHLALAGLVSISGIAQSAKSLQQKPNILFIAIDDLKPILGCYGDTLVKTPNIDKLARMGILFTRGYCQQSLSGPTRVSLLTGMYPDDTRVWGMRKKGDNFRMANPTVISLPQNFKNNGYETAGIGKIFDERTVDHGSDSASWSVPFLDFTKYYDSNYPKPFMNLYQDPNTLKLVEKFKKEFIANGGNPAGAAAYARKHIFPSTESANVSDRAYGDGAMAEGAIEFLNKYDKSKPLFLAVGFHRPHLPFNSPQKYWDLYNRKDMPLAAFREKAKNSPDFAYVPHGGYQEIEDYTDIPPLSTFTDIGTVKLPEDKQRELIHGYYAAVSYVDAQVGKLLDALKQNGMDKNTIVVLWGDHGWHLGDHSLWAKQTNFEQATHVPFLIYNPQLSHQVITSPVEFIDFFPTLCEMTSIPAPQQLKGKSLVPLIKNETVTSTQYKYAVSQFPRGDKMGYSIRSERFRYTVWIKWSGKMNGYTPNEKPNMDTSTIYAEELYDYVKDPNETVNVANQKEYQQDLNIMRSYWQEFARKHVNSKMADTSKATTSSFNPDGKPNGKYKKIKSY